MTTTLIESASVPGVALPFAHRPRRVVVEVAAAPVDLARDVRTVDQLAALVRGATSLRAADALEPAPVAGAAATYLAELRAQRVYWFLIDGGALRALPVVLRAAGAITQQEFLALV